MLDHEGKSKGGERERVCVCERERERKSARYWWDTERDGVNVSVLNYSEGKDEDQLSIIV